MGLFLGFVSSFGPQNRFSDEAFLLPRTSSNVLNHDDSCLEISFRVRHFLLKIVFRVRHFFSSHNEFSGEPFFAQYQYSGEAFFLNISFRVRLFFAKSISVEAFFLLTICFRVKQRHSVELRK